MIKDSAFKYFRAFADKDTSTLRNMLVPTVTLRDWDIYAEGLDAVIAVNSNIFNAVKTIVVTPVNIYVNDTTVIAELNIEIDGGEPLKVVDILQFDRDEKICSIRAYKG
jgi:hypothetical protein